MPDMLISGTEFCLFLFICCTDLLRFRVPNLALALLGSLASIRMISSGSWELLLSATLLGALFQGIRTGGHALKGRPVMGAGDVRLAAVCGLGCSPGSVPLFLVTAGSLGLLTGLLYRLFRARDFFPLAPAMIVALGVVRVGQGW
jgi:prepilin signal peptidase PulO-like enzyme (type II secretory pathway)